MKSTGVRKQNSVFLSGNSPVFEWQQPYIIWVVYSKGTHGLEVTESHEPAVLANWSSEPTKFLSFESLSALLTKE